VDLFPSCVSGRPIMRIAQVCPRYYPNIGGIESHVQAISERLVRRGFEVDVLTTDPTGRLAREETANGVRVVRFKSWAPSDSYYFSSEMRDFLAKSDDHYDIVHAHSYHAMPALYASQARAGKKFVFTPHYHGTGHTSFRRLLHVPWRYYARQIFDTSDLIISVSNFERDLILKDFGLDSRKVVLVPDGLNLHEFDSGSVKRAANRDGTVRILCVSRLERYKGIQYLLKCLAGLDNNFTLEVIGSGPFKPELVREACNLGVTSRVSFIEGLRRDELLSRYREARVFVLLSKHEAFGIVVAEALASGLPCVVSRASALAEWIDNESCFGIDYPIDVNALSGLVAKTATLPSVSRHGLVDWEEVANKMAKMYAKLEGLSVVSS
jgi:glycosyltransferase involved in cell wall biosynthesis